MGLSLFLSQIATEPLLQSAEAFEKISIKLLVRLMIDLASVVMLINVVYFPVYKKRELNFTFCVFNLIIFLVCFLLNKVDLSMGAAFGLFAVFSMLRYRTEEISLKDMTYLFLFIALGLVNAVTKIKDASNSYEYIFIAGINAGVILLAVLLESRLFSKKENTKIINYERMDLVNENNKSLLVEDLKNRTGLEVHRVSVMKIDFVNDTAQLKVYYYER